jgi:RNA polymerase sigma-70 factor (ECF subfamily)
LGQSETELIRGLRQGEAAAFHALVDGYADRLHGLAYSLLGNAADADDAVQETLAGVYRSIGSFRQDAALWTWLVQILVRQAARIQRSSWRRKVIKLPADALEGAAGSHPSPQRGVDARIDLQTAMEKLAPENRQILVLRELEQMSSQQIAVVLGVPIGTVESRLYRARLELRQKLAMWKP